MNEKRTLTTVVNYNSKAIGAGIGAAVGVIVIWLLQTYASVDMPEAVQNAITIVAATIITWLFPANHYGT